MRLFLAKNNCAERTLDNVPLDATLFARHRRPCAISQKRVMAVVFTADARRFPAKLIDLLTGTGEWLSAQTQVRGKPRWLLSS